MVLEHIPQRDVALHRMLEAVKPGGWVVIEDIDASGNVIGSSLVQPEDAAAAFLAAWRGIFSFMTQAGFDGDYAQRLPMTLIALGLTDVECESRAKLIRGGTTAAAFPELSLVHLREPLVAAGALTGEQAATALEVMRDPASAWMMLPLMSACGRKPR
jgi:hypothetical protein